MTNISSFDMFLYEFFRVKNSIGHLDLSHIEFILTVYIFMEQILKIQNNLVFNAQISYFDLIIPKLNLRFTEFKYAHKFNISHQNLDIEFPHILVSFERNFH